MLYSQYTNIEIFVFQEFFIVFRYKFSDYANRKIISITLRAKSRRKKALAREKACRRKCRRFWQISSTKSSTRPLVDGNADSFGDFRLQNRLQPFPITIRTPHSHLPLIAIINKIYLQFLDRLTPAFVVCLYGS